MGLSFLFCFVFFVIYGLSTKAFLGFVSFWRGVFRFGQSYRDQRLSGFCVISHSSLSINAVSGRILCPSCCFWKDGVVVFLAGTLTGYHRAAAQKNHKRPWITKKNTRCSSLNAKTYIFEEVGDWLLACFDHIFTQPKLLNHHFSTEIFR